MDVETCDSPCIDRLPEYYSRYSYSRAHETTAESRSCCPPTRRGSDRGGTTMSDTTLVATKRTRVPGDSRYEAVTARGVVVARGDESVRFRADNGEEREFRLDEWHVEVVLPADTEGL